MSSLELRTIAEQIFRAGVSAVDPRRLLLDRSRIENDEWHYEAPGVPDVPDVNVSWDLPKRNTSGRLLVIGAGKAAASLAQALEETVGDRIDGGRIIVKHGHGLPLKHLVVEEGGHPLPDEGGLEGTSRLIDDLEDTRPDDRVFFLLTGGASALLIAPAPGLTLSDKIETTQALLACGAKIQEINTIRKHLSAVKGGRLAERIHPAKAMTLIVSDVVGDELSSIGSGPTVPDPSTFADCLDVLKRHDLHEKIPATVRDWLDRGARGGIAETPKQGLPFFENIRCLILASNRHSLEAAQRVSEALGFLSGSL